MGSDLGSDPNPHRSPGAPLLSRRWNNLLPIQHLPPLVIEGHRSSGAGGPDHPMRIATRRAAGLDADGWTRDLRDQVADYFDDLLTNGRRDPRRSGWPS